MTSKRTELLVQAVRNEYARVSSEHSALLVKEVELIVAEKFMLSVSAVKAMVHDYGHYRKVLPKRKNKI